MAGIGQETKQHSMGINDVLYVLFKHKWKIVILGLIGLGLAVAAYLRIPTAYESEAKLLVRYVVDRSAVDNVETSKAVGGAYGDSLINAEVEILKSWDLAMKVVDSLTPEKLLPKAKEKPSREAAAEVVRGGLTVLSKKGSNVIIVSYKNLDPVLASSVLDELVKLYFDKHLEVHRSAGSFNFVAQQSEQVKARLNETEEQLKQLKAKSGVTSLVESTASLNNQILKAQDDLNTVQAQLAESDARVREMEKLAGIAPSSALVPESVIPDGGATSQGQSGATPQVQVAPAPPPAAAPPSNEVIQLYQSIGEQLSMMRKSRLDLLSRYTEENLAVKMNKDQIDRLTAQQADLVKNNPGLGTTVAQSPLTPNSSQEGILSERANFAALKAKTEAIRGQLEVYMKRREMLSEIGPQIQELERKKEMEEGNYKYFQSSLEKARIDEALDPSKMPNISTVQKPSPAFKSSGNREKIVLGLLAFGLLSGVGLAFLIEMVLDPTIKRPIDLRGKLDMPLLLSVPLQSNGARPLLQLGAPKSGSGSEVALNTVSRAATAPWEMGHFIRRFSEDLRDRLITYFEIRSMSHKPKLVAVTGCSHGVGTSTIAGGLAAALSETGDGKVLLVDMNLGSTEIHPFFKGKPSSSIADALEAGASIASAADNLYLATAHTPSSGPTQLAPRRFYEMVPHFKASDFDYIIFDMPAMNESSATLSMAGFMDKVLLVVEAEGSNRDTIQQAYTELLEAKADVSSICNKTRSYAPKWLKRDF